MTSESSTTQRVWIAIDVAKAFHQVLIETFNGHRRAWRVANAADELAQKVRGDPSRRAFVELREGELTDPIDGDEQIELSFVRPDVREIDVEVPQRLGLELLARSRTLRPLQTAYPVALEEAMQR